MGEEIIHVRESHMVPCAACGLRWDEWDASISLDEAIARIQRDPAALDELLTRACPNCEHRMEWDAAIVSGDERGTLTPSRQRRLAGTFRRLLREGATREEMGKTVREMYDVVAFYVPSR